MAAFEKRLLYIPTYPHHPWFFLCPFKTLCPFLGTRTIRSIYHIFQFHVRSIQRRPHFSWTSLKKWLLHYNLNSNPVGVALATKCSFHLICIGIKRLEQHQAYLYTSSYAIYASLKQNTPRPKILPLQLVISTLQDSLLIWYAALQGKTLSGSGD